MRLNPNLVVQAVVQVLTEQNKKQYKNIQKTPQQQKQPQKRIKKEKRARITKVNKKYEKKGRGRIENMKMNKGEEKKE